MNKALAGKFGNFADRAYQAADFASALEAAEEAIKYGPDLRWLRVNRAHALMFVGRVDEACVLHMDDRGKEFELGGLWEEGVKADFTRLRDNDRRHPLMEKIEAMFQNPPDDCRTGIFRTLSRLIVR